MQFTETISMKHTNFVHRKLISLKILDGNEHEVQLVQNAYKTNRFDKKGLPVLFSNEQKKNCFMDNKSNYKSMNMNSKG